MNLGTALEALHNYTKSLDQYDVTLTHNVPETLSFVERISFHMLTYYNNTQAFFKVMTDIPLVVWTEPLKKLPIIWSAHLFDLIRPNVFLLECDIPDQQIPTPPIAVSLLTSSSDVGITNITELIKTIQNAAASQAVLFIELLFHEPISFAQLSEVGKECELLQHAKNIFHATCTMSTDSEDYVGLEQIFTQAFWRNCSQMIAVRSSKCTLGRAKS